MKTTVSHEFEANHLNEFGAGRLQFAKKDENLEVLEDITISLGDDNQMAIAIAKWLRYQLSDYSEKDIANSKQIVDALFGYTQGSELPEVLKYWDKTVQVIVDEVKPNDAA